MAVSVAESASQLLSQLTDFARRPRLHRTLASALLVAALLSGTATYATLSGAFGIQGSTEMVQFLLLLDLILLLLLGAERRRAAN